MEKLRERERERGVESERESDGERDVESVRERGSVCGGSTVCFIMSLALQKAEMTFCAPGTGAVSDQ